MGLFSAGGNSLTVAVGEAYRNLSLAQRLGLVVGLCYAVMFAVLGFLSLQIVTESKGQILRERLVVAEMAAAEIDLVMAKAFRELEIARDAAPFDPTSVDFAAEQHALTHAYIGIGAFSSGVYFLDAAGRVVFAEVPDSSSPWIDLASREEIQEVLRTGQAGVSSPFVDARTGGNVAAVVVPVKQRGVGERVISYLVGVIALDGPWVRGILEQAARLEETGHGEVVDERGMVLASTGARGYLGPGEHPEFYRRQARLRRMSVEEVAYESDDEYGGRPGRHVMAYVPLTAVPWAVALGGDSDETFAQITRLRNTVLPFAVLTLCVTLLAVLIGTRRLVRPIRSLTASARRISAGDLRSLIRVNETGEIRVLAETLEEMRARLEESLDELTRRGDELEERVKQRTSELERRNRELSITANVATCISQSLNLAQGLDEVLDTLIASLRLRFAEVFVFEDATPVSKCRKGSWDGELGDWSTVVKGGREPMSVEERRAEGGSQVWSVPFRANNQEIGALVVQTWEGVDLGVADSELLRIIGHQIGIALENARLIDELGKLEAMRKLDRMKSDFVSSVSHELRTPLGFIKGYVTTLLRLDVSTPEDTRREFLEIIREESEKLQELVDNLLDTSRLHVGGLGVEKEPVSVPDIARLVIERAKTRTANHAFAVDFPPEFPVLPADPRRIEQLLTNLVDNAIKYAPAGGRISLRGEARGGRVTVTVQDEGEGIPTDDLSRVFEPFYRVNNPLTRRVRGNGLGLFICRGIVEAHEGQLWAESAPGRGAALRFTLPLAHEAVPLETFRCPQGEQS